MTTIAIDQLTKRFGSVRAVEGLTFRAEPGTVTGFLGPNGAGKTTTLRILLGLVNPTSGTATFGGRPYAALSRPSSEVGAVLEATSFHPGRSARDHLRVICAGAGLPERRADEVLGLTGLSDAAGRKAGNYSLGMRQRLALATAMLGDPRVLILDEPANGLDPAGINWLRGFLRHLADQGRTVLFSSHVLSEVEQTVDHVVIVAQGRLVRDAPLAELTAQSGRLRVRTLHQAELAAALERAGGRVVREGDHLTVSGATAEDVGRAALAAQAVLTGLEAERSGLEEIFLNLTAGDPQQPPSMNHLEEVVR